MENIDKSTREYYVVDLMHILKTLWRKAWVLVLTGIAIAGIAFSYSTFFITPKYSSQIMLYVNNSSFSVGNTSFSISSSEISAAQSLVKTYIVILNNRTTLEKVIENTGVDYTYEQLSGMIVAAPVDDTEIFSISVTSDDPEEAALIANGIARVLPRRVSEIIDGSSMKVVDMAVVDTQKVSPNITKYTAFGFTLGFFFAFAVVAIYALFDNTIRNEEYILQKYDFPVLAKIPNLLDSESKSGHYYYSSSSASKKDKK